MPWIGLDATFTAGHPVRGVAAMVQSGGVGIALLEQMSRLGMGVSSFASAGDKADMSPTDLLTWWAQDEVTQIAVLYVESFGNPRKFAGTARRVAQRMPVLTVIGARSPAGHRAASHTAAAATPLAQPGGHVRPGGRHRRQEPGELVDAAAMLSCQPLQAGTGSRSSPTRRRGRAGRRRLRRPGLQVAQLGAATQRALRALLPPAAVVTGPVDTCAVVTTEAFRACVQEVAADEGVDAVLAVAVPTAFSDVSAAVAEAVISKPLAVASSTGPSRCGGSSACPSHCRHRLARGHRPGGGPHRRPGGGGHRRGGRGHQECPVTPTLIMRPARWPRGPVPGLARAAGGKVPELDGLRVDDARALVTGFLAGSPDGGWLRKPAQPSWWPARHPVGGQPDGGQRAEAAAAAAQLGGPVVLKTGRGTVHRTGAGGVRVDLRTPQEVADGYRMLVAGSGLRLQRVLVQPMLEGGVEVMIGVAQEPVLGRWWCSVPAMRPPRCPRRSTSAG